MHRDAEGARVSLTIHQKPKLLYLIFIMIIYTILTFLKVPIVPKQDSLLLINDVRSLLILKLNYCSQNIFSKLFIILNSEIKAERPK